ncbi:MULTISPECIES: class I SAM-dependent methyltransferase [unclassified Corynebacterium]|uniref:class I SAM-dependent methyltransferase n=1 Tax=unclassified Corynebacterium TaxID=2624378 RepID=UPI0034CDE033
MSTQPDPRNFPSYRRPSEKEGPEFRGAAHRTATARAFGHGAGTYHDVRPSYPTEVAQLLAGHSTVVDVGAGTGKLTQLLAAVPGVERVWAVDPSADMARVLNKRLAVPTWRAKAEATALPEASVDAVAAAQTWHWVDVPAACAEFDRIVRPGGHVLLVWNTLDVTDDPWLLRLARIMHSGDVQKPGFLPALAAPWVIERELRTTFYQELFPPQLHQLMHTRAYWLRNGEKIHQRMTHNLNWYLREHTGLRDEDAVQLRYHTDAFLLRRA